MTLSNSPLRVLVKTYANGLLDRTQYLEIRSQLLRKLSSSGHISHEDLQNFLKIHQDTENNETRSRYSASDWVIIILGVMAASTLVYIFLA